MPQSRYAYTDESGNTGLNLFDSNQPTFWTGTLVAFHEVDSAYSGLHAELLKRAGVGELHAAKMGFAGIEKIAKRIRMILARKRIHFLFGRVDKKFLAATKFFDLVFDSGTNLAVSGHTYGIQQMRLINTMHFVQLLTEDDLKEFWDLFQKQDAARFAKLMTKVLSTVADSPFDQRTQQILSEALEWGAKYPQEVLDPFSERDSPNFVAFTGLFGHLHQLHLDSGHLISSFVHDEQNQFMKTFEESYELVSKWKHDEGPLTLISDIKPIGSFEGELIERSSANSFGLQLVDICLWLMRRVIDKGDELTGELGKLVDWLFLNSYIVRFDFGQIASTVARDSQVVESFPFDEQKEAKAKELLASIRAAQQTRIDAHANVNLTKGMIV